MISNFQKEVFKTFKSNFPVVATIHEATYIEKDILVTEILDKNNIQRSITKTNIAIDLNGFF